MNHYKARQRKDGRWDYTCANKVIWPVGYCHAFDNPREWTFGVSESEIVKIEANKEKYHSTGHDSEEDACACYKNYLLDNQLCLQMTNENAQHKCQICQEWTQMSASCSGSYFDLCSNHNNREGVASLLKVGESWES